MSNKIKLLFTGDIYLKNTEKPFIGSKFLDLIQQHDFISCNFEAPIYTGNAKPIKKVGPSIYMPEQSAKAIIDTGFNVINLANNHIFDLGEKSLEATLQIFNSICVIGAGLDFDTAYTLKIEESNGIKLGFLAFGEAGFGAIIDKNLNDKGYAWINHPAVNNKVKQAKQKVDILIIQVHAGVEDIELPLPEWRQRYKELIDLGADAVIGHHPHVPQGWEVYNTKPIFYSLGNFYFEGNENILLWNKGYTVSLTCDYSGISDFEVIPVQKTAQIVDIYEEEAFNNYLNSISKVLGSSTYIKKINQQTVKLWYERYLNYYIETTGNFYNQNLLKSLYKLIFRRKKIYELLLLHNIQIESHRWATERALMLLNLS